jgi:DeoR/GlpR family transcriptional regulator of sugar metabolism
MSDKVHKRRENILMRLFYGESVNTTDLARQFGVSTKTIQNDLKELMTMYEIISEKKGTYRLAQSNRIIEQEYRDTLRALVYALATHAFRGFEKDIKVLLGHQRGG